MRKTDQIEATSLEVHTVVEVQPPFPADGCPNCTVPLFALLYHVLYQALDQPLSDVLAFF